MKKFRNNGTQELGNRGAWLLESILNIQTSDKIDVTSIAGLDKIYKISNAGIRKQWTKGKKDL